MVGKKKKTKQTNKKKTAISISLNSFNRLALVLEVLCIFYEAGTAILTIN
jgi:hypothetical protein